MRARGAETSVRGRGPGRPVVSFGRGGRGEGASEGRDRSTDRSEERGRARVGLQELQRRKRATLRRIEAMERDSDALRARAKELERGVERDRARLEAYDKVIKDGECSLDRILESSEFLLNALSRETRGFEDDDEEK